MAEKNETFAVPANGTFCWMELASNDAAASQKFYGELFGWKLNTKQPVPGFDYTEFGVDEKPLGGMWQITEECKAMSEKEMSSHWMPYVAVENVDDAATRAFELGGKICVPPTDIPNVGRFCVIDDPSGATISLITMKGAN